MPSQKKREELTHVTEKRVTYPLTPSQETLFLARKFSVHKSVTNIATSLIIRGVLDIPTLEKAIRIGIGRWDSFGVRLQKHRREIRQYFGERACEEIVRKDFSGGKPEQVEAFFHREARKKMKIFDCPLARMFIIRTPEGHDGIFSVMSHLMMDSWAISYFYKDVMGIYYALMDNTPMPKEMKSCEGTLKKDLDYVGSVRWKKDQAFWETEYQKSEPFYTHVNGLVMLERYRKWKRNPDIRYGRSFFLRTTASILQQDLSGEDVEKMKDFARENELPSVQVLFLMGIRMYLSNVNGHQEDVGFYDVVARRGTLEEKLSGGTRVHFFPLRTIMTEDMTFAEGINLLLDTQNEMYRHADFSPMEIINIEKKFLPVSMMESYRTVALTYQPISMVLSSKVKFDARWYSNGAAGNPFYVTIMDGDGSGNLKCYYEYMDRQIRQETVLQCHEFMKKVILQGISNPEMTLGEIYML